MSLVHLTAEEIRRAVEQGPITKEYQADAVQIVKELNRLRSTEITSYLLKSDRW